MNIVLVRHGDSKQYAFYVPDELLGLVHRNMGVLCKTRHGLSYGTTDTGVISGDGARDIAMSVGAYIPLKPIVGIDHPALAEGPRIRRAAKEDFIEKLASAFEKQ